MGSCGLRRIIRIAGGDFSVVRTTRCPDSRSEQEAAGRLSIARSFRLPPVAPLLRVHPDNKLSGPRDKDSGGYLMSLPVDRRLSQS